MTTGLAVRRVDRLPDIDTEPQPVKNTEIVVLGLAYKPDTSDARETPALPIVNQLVELGAKVTVVDPLVRDALIGEPLRIDGVRFVRSVDEASIDDVALAVLVTDHDAFDYEDIERRAKLIFDTRHRFGGLKLGNVEHL